MDPSSQVWDPSLRVPEKVCIQTLLGHGGTVTCMALVGRNNLVSGSTDATVRLWRAGAKEQGSAAAAFTLVVSANAPYRSRAQDIGAGLCAAAHGIGGTGPRKIQARDCWICFAKERQSV